jgi:hypothetical protein
MNRKRNHALLTAFLLAPLALLHAAEPPLVLILSGQSNMAGYGKAAELSAEWRTPPPSRPFPLWMKSGPLSVPFRPKTRSPFASAPTA